MKGSESDVPDDPHVAGSRHTGGRDPSGEPDTHSTTGTTESGGFVGRIAGEEAADTDESGAERRAEAQRQRAGN
ncbi:MAG: hypothetical protein J2P19_09085 [Pseudonocardia sp.]|nr:hypothetical protein [Pseudonocardia sp.]